MKKMMLAIALMSLGMTMPVIAAPNDMPPTNGPNMTDQSGMDTNQPPPPANGSGSKSNSKSKGNKSSNNGGSQNCSNCGDDQDGTYEDDEYDD